MLQTFGRLGNQEAHSALLPTLASTDGSYELTQQLLNMYSEFFFFLPKII